MEAINQKGLVFSTDAILGLAIVLLTIAGLAMNTQNPAFQPNPAEWQQTNTILNAQTNWLSNSPSDYQGPEDYYCYQLYDLRIGLNKSPETIVHCEETK